MVLNNKFLFLLVALIAANLIFAHRHSDDGENPPPEDEGSPPPEEGSPGQGRTFFLTTRFVRCNYTAQAGRTCASCRQALHCSRNNFGRLRTCRGLFRYCNQGSCSFYGGSACSGASG